MDPSVAEETAEKCLKPVAPEVSGRTPSRFDEMLEQLSSKLVHLCI